MESPSSAADMLPLFYVGEHSTTRPLPVSTELVHHAQDLGVSSSPYEKKQKDIIFILRVEYLPLQKASLDPY